MGLRKVSIALLSSAFLSLSCSVNILSSFSNETDDAYILSDIDELLNARDYAGALVKFQTLSTTAQGLRDNKVLLATIQLGICDMEFLDFTQDLANVGATNLLKMFMQSFNGASASTITACIAAETAIKSVNTDASQRSVKENILMAFTAMAKMGAILNTYFDTNDDGNTDAALNVCTTTPLSSANAKEMATAFGNMMLSLAATAGSSDVGGDQFATFDAACDALAAINPAYNFCAITDTASVTADMEKGIRSLIKEDSAVGIGVSCTGDLTACNCP